MNIETKNIFVAFLIAAALTLCIPILLPQWRLLFLVPCIVIVYYQKPLLTSLWISCFCGLFLDLLASGTHFGLYACSYTLASAVLYGQRRHFFADSISTLPLMTFFFSSLVTAIQWVLVYGFEHHAPLSIQWFAIDLIYMPILDAVYAFFFFVLPNLFFGKKAKRGQDYFAR